MSQNLLAKIIKTVGKELLKVLISEGAKIIIEALNNGGNGKENA